MTTAIIKGVSAVKNAMTKTIATYINSMLDIIWSTWQLTATLSSDVSVGATTFIASANLGTTSTGEVFCDASGIAETVQVDFSTRSGTGPYTYSLISGTAFKFAHLANISLLSDPQTGTIIPKCYPVAVYDGIHQVIPQMPAITVMGVRGKQPLNGAPNWAQIDHYLDISVILTGDDAFVMHHQLERYLIALWQIFMEHQPLNLTITGQCGIDPLEYGNSGIFKQKESSMMTLAGGWSVVVHVIETV